MLHRKKNAKFRSTRIIFAVIGCVLGLILLIVMAKFRIDPERAKIEAKTKEVVTAAKEREVKRQAAVEQARAALPPDAGIPRDWSLDACLQALHPNRTAIQLGDITQFTRLLLSEEDSTPANADAGQNKTLPGRVLASGETVTRSGESDLQKFQNRIDNARQAGNITPIEDSLDVTKYGRDAVLSNIDTYLTALRPLQEAEAAYEHGIFFAEAPTSVRNTGPSSFALIDALACRAVFESRRGEIDKAIHTYSNAQDMQRIVTEARNTLPSPDFFHLERIADFAWRIAPLTQTQRDQLFAHVALPIPPERLVEIMHRMVQANRDDLERVTTEQRRQTMGAARVLIIQYVASRDSSAMNRSIQQLTPLVALPPYQALPAMERIGAEESERKIFAVFSPWLASQIAVRHATSALNNAMLDVIRVAFALKDYRHAHGEYPKTLDALSPDPIPPLPTDPFSGQPMLYESDGKTFTIALEKMAKNGGQSIFNKRIGGALATRATRWHAQE